MVLIIKHKCKLYKRYKYDIWGLCYIKTHNFYKNWLIRFFFKLYKEAEMYRYERMKKYIYRLDIFKRKARRRKLSLRFLSLRLAKLYFLTLKDYQFRVLFKRASKLDGNLENNYCLLLEGRILSLFYRTNFMSNFFEIIQFIRQKNILIDGKKTSIHLNYSVPLYSLISFNSKFRFRIKRNLFKRLKNRLVLFNTPRFLFVSYFFFFGCLCKMPSYKDLVYPIGIDLYRLSGYN